MTWKIVIFLILLYGGAAALQARRIVGARGKNSLQDRCLIPLILALLVLALTAIGWWRAAGWGTLGWSILVYFGALPLAAAVGLGTLAGLWLRRKRPKTEEKP